MSREISISKTNPSMGGMKQSVRLGVVAVSSVIQRRRGERVTISII